MSNSVNYISPIWHLHFTSNSLPRIISVTECERMQLQVVLKLLWVRNKHLDSLKTTLVFVMWKLIFEDTLWRFGLVSCTCFYKRLYPDGSKSQKKKVDLMMSTMHSKSITLSFFFIYSFSFMHQGFTWTFLFKSILFINIIRRILTNKLDSTFTMISLKIAAVIYTKYDSIEPRCFHGNINLPTTFTGRSHYPGHKQEEALKSWRALSSFQWHELR